MAGLLASWEARAPTCRVSWSIVPRTQDRTTVFFQFHTSLFERRVGACTLGRQHLFKLKICLIQLCLRLSDLGFRSRFVRNGCFVIVSRIGSRLADAQFFLVLEHFYGLLKDRSLAIQGRLRGTDLRLSQNKGFFDLVEFKLCGPNRGFFRSVEYRKEQLARLHPASVVHLDARHRTAVLADDRHGPERNEAGIGLRIIIEDGEENGKSEHQPNEERHVDVIERHRHPPPTQIKDAQHEGNGSNGQLNHGRSLLRSAAFFAPMQPAAFCRLS